MKTTFTATFRVTREQLAGILGVCTKTASKEYQTILDSLEIVNRNYLTYGDLAKYGIIEFNAVR